jgi:hypothetical protein
MMGGGAAFFGGGGGGNLAMFGGGSRGGDISLRGGRRSGMMASIRGGNRIALFGGAARGMVPGNEMNQFRAGSSTSVASIDNRRMAMLQGPLDVDNWQSTRVSSLVVRNVPGSNIHAQSAGMAG